MGRAALAGLHGEERTAEQLIAEATEPVASLGLSIVLAKAEFARGVTHLTAGRHSDAFDHFMRMFDPHGPAYPRSGRICGRALRHRMRGASGTEQRSAPRDDAARGSRQAHAGSPRTHRFAVRTSVTRGRLRGARPL